MPLVPKVSAEGKFKLKVFAATVYSTNFSLPLGISENEAILKTGFAVQGVVLQGGVAFPTMSLPGEAFAS